MAEHCSPDPEDIADRFLVGHLSPADAEEFALHVATCVRCRKILDNSRNFRDGLKSAFQTLVEFPLKKKID
jgi:hypothetical protein